jgi:hypothetical protein
MDSVDDLGTVDALEVNAGDGEVGVSELPLDDDEWNAFVCHLDRMSVSKLVRGEAPASSCRRSGVMELLSGCGGLPVPSGRWTVDHAQQRSDRQLPPPLLPGFELGPGPSVHADLASLPAFAMADKDRAASRVKIALLKSERFADTQARAP